MALISIITAAIASYNQLQTVDRRLQIIESEINSFVK